MFVFAFFMAVFCSVSWLIYAGMFVRLQLNGEVLSTQSPESLLIYLAVVLLPILIVWVIFGYINQFSINRVMSRKQTELLQQLQKNQDYTDLVVRVMLDAEHEIKDGFVLNKFDVFISDMNEALGEIIQRCNIASSAQLEQLWQRVRRGERWTLGKAVLDASKNQSTFEAWVGEKVRRDKVFRGSLLEFCSRYQNLLQLLEKHDRDRVFINMIEAGVFGKVYSIIAPLSEGLKQPTETVQVQTQNNDYASVLKIATIEEPLANETIKNVDRSEDDEEYEEEIVMPKEPFLARLNPFRRRAEEPYIDEEHDDPFFQALHSSFQNSESPADIKDISFSGPVGESSLVAEHETDESNGFAVSEFGYSRTTLDNLRSSNDAMSVDIAAPTETADRSVTAERQEPSLAVREIKATKQEQQDEEDLIYPFGGWTDEKNYHQ